MARSWAELLGDAEGPEEPTEERHGFFGRLRDSLGKSRRALTGELAAATFDPGNDEDWERLEEALIQRRRRRPRDRRARAPARGARRADRPERGARGGDRRACSASPARSNLPGEAERDPRRRRQRHGQDDDDRQARAEAARARPHASCSAPPTPCAPRPRSSSRSGPSARRPTSSAPRAAPIPPRSPTTPSRPRARAARTSRSSTPPQPDAPRQSASCRAFHELNCTPPATSSTTPAATGRHSATDPPAHLRRHDPSPGGPDRHPDHGPDGEVARPDQRRQPVQLHPPRPAHGPTIPHQHRHQGWQHHRHHHQHPHPQVRHAAPYPV